MIGRLWRWLTAGDLMLWLRAQSIIDDADGSRDRHLHGKARIRARRAGGA